jgi:CRP/FNR family cyclic AMP-dependent transcriptional regulator
MSSTILTKVPLFAGLAPDEIDHVAALVRRRRYPQGTLIHGAGTMGADLFVLESGRVTLQLPSDRGEELAMRLLKPGDFFGEISLLDDEPWYGDAIATDDCMLLLLGKLEFFEVLDRYPSVSRRLLIIICKRLRHHARLAQDLAFLDVPTRLARALVTLAESERWGWTDEERSEQCPLVDITQSALAAHVGATRESINKWLGYYERLGYISRQRESITVLRLDELRSRSCVR